MQKNPPRIIYIYDAYCGWCYGFSPVIKAFHEKYRSELSFDVISGGLITGQRVGPMEPELADYIKKTVPRLESLTGVKFSKEYMEKLGDPKRINDSMFPARAMAVLRKHHPERSVEFASWLQNELFGKGRDLLDESVYRDAAQSFSINENDFIREMNAASDEAMADFNQAHQWGISGFPAVVFDRGDTLILLSNGFTDLKSLEQALAQAKEFEAPKSK